VGRRATYRVQLHAGFGFDDVAGITDYLADLGITHVYCSPYLQAVPGSTHGYDVVDPCRLNDELGGAAGHARMTGALRSAGLGQILDIVPNHMATDPLNRWWWDVLENGPASPYAHFFDIHWTETEDRLNPTVLVPILGDHYGRVLEAGGLVVERSGGHFRVRYYERCLPLSPRTVDSLLYRAARRTGCSELAAVAQGLTALPAVAWGSAAAVAWHRHQCRLVAELARLCATNAELAAGVDEEVVILNEDVDRLDELLQSQSYRLAHWRLAGDKLDYRRFFSIETLVGVRVEAPDVFAATHRLVIDLVRDGTLAGLRVDHVDGMRDPEGYLRTLAEQTGGRYTVVEKIIEAEEGLPDTWPVAGTTGYDFLNRVNRLFVAAGHEQAMTDCYVDFSGETASYPEVVYRAKQHVMATELGAEVERLVGMLARICDGSRRHQDHSRRGLHEALLEVVSHFPVYRTYLHPRRAPTPADRACVDSAVAAAQAHRPDLDAELVRFVGELALGQAGGDRGMEFALQLQQLTGPVMAKGVEDTAFYRYNRFVSLNEVGGDPGTFGRPVEAFHADTARTAERWPESMLTLSTHDTKRSGDVRARLNVLSELPGPWAAAVNRWTEIGDRYRTGGWPDRNTEYLLYQTLVGAWPLDVERAVAVMAKSTREAKVHTSWVDPVVEYDEATEVFVRSLLANPAFLLDLERFLIGERLVARGRRNSLAQTTLSLTCPGVPDVYQGTELWDLSLVDPDNRRPVDYRERRRQLALVRQDPAGAPDARDDTGYSKMWLVYRLLEHRRRRERLYASVEYEPLAFTGARGGDLVGFGRGSLAVVVPRCGDDHWEGTDVELRPGRWTDVLTGVDHDGGRLSVDRLLAGFPVAVLERGTRGTS
jgi:(1->4)-alpha-D-glucan 1-alpha-D-glucosylmutase